MRLEFSGIITRASGPFLGRAAGYRLRQVKRGASVLELRKKHMTTAGDTHVTNWNKLCWIWTDVLWTLCDQADKNTCTRCAKRTATVSRSGLDEFRHVNLTRLIIGMPPLRRAPDRFRSLPLRYPRSP